MGLSGLSALVKAFHICTLLQKGVGENGLRFAEEWQSSPEVHTRTTCRNPKIERQTRVPD